MSLRDALAFAHEHQPLIRAGLARVAARAQDARVPSARWLPTVGVTGQILVGTANNTTASFLTVDALDIPRIGGAPAALSPSAKPYGSTLVGAGIRQEVFDFGRIEAQRAAADALVQVDKEASSVTLLDVDFNVEEAYFAVWAAKGVLQASDEAYARAKTHRDFAKAGVDSGLRPPIELTRANAMLAGFDIGRIRARGGVVVAEEVLAAAIGAPGGAVDVTGQPPTPAEMPSLPDAMRQASVRDPAVRRALAQLKADEQQTKAIGAELRPNVWLSATATTRAGGAGPEDSAGSGWLPDVPNWDAGLVLTWPLFDGVVLARRDAARVHEEVGREELGLVREQQVARITQAYLAFTTTHNVLPGLEEAVGSARANYDQADARFRAGLGNAVELADAEDLRTGAEINLALGQFDVARARAAFGRAIAEEL